jgi:hypothetical protein
VGVVPQNRFKNEPALAAAKLQLDENSIAGAKAQYFLICFFGTTEVVPCYKTFQNKILLQIDELLPAMIQMRLP